ncbi:putative ABC transporter permease [Clostridium nigeriense]|uniref:putative ABC transporter permease n=1 Tax=Clostridium nigeriense TaxID=1805470 RepID=UPI003D35804A
MWLLTWLLYFSVYSFLGWICEVIYCSIPEKKIINRGFLNGPVCPVYGFGALFVICIMEWLNIDSPILIFIFGGVIASIIEFIADILLEYVFHTRLWNYSNRRFNIKGRVCLLNSTLFATLALVLLEIIHPLIVGFISKFSNLSIILAAILILIIFIVDMSLTVSEVVNLNITLKNMNILDKLKKEFNKKELKPKRVRRLIEAFPQLEHKKYKDELKKLKSLIKESIENNIKL